eukprot:1139033-Pelagomonas_calceolata.AAC.2
MNQSLLPESASIQRHVPENACKLASRGVIGCKDTEVRGKLPTPDNHVSPTTHILNIQTCNLGSGTGNNWNYSLLLSAGTTRQWLCWLCAPLRVVGVKQMRMDK